MGYGAGISEAFGCLIWIIIILIVIVVIAGIYFFFFSSGDIVSDHLITPTIQLTIKNNIVDTLYIYKKP